MPQFKDLGSFVKVDQQNPPYALQFDLQNIQKINIKNRHFPPKKTMSDTWCPCNTRRANSNTKMTCNKNGTISTITDCFFPNTCDLEMGQGHQNQIGEAQWQFYYAQFLRSLLDYYCAACAVSPVLKTKHHSVSRGGWHKHSHCWRRCWAPYSGTWSPWALCPASHQTSCSSPAEVVSGTRSAQH